MVVVDLVEAAIGPRRVHKISRGGGSWAEHPIGGAAHACRALVRDVSVDHGGAYIMVAQKLLDRPVVAVFRQTGGVEQKVRPKVASVPAMA